MLNLAQLNRLLEPLSNIGKGEKVVDVAGVSVTIRNLTPLEESEVQKALPKMEGDEATPLDFVDVFRRETLARSIVQVGDLDLRGLEYVETGETLPNGKPIKVSKTEALMRMISTWSRPVFTKLFEQYGLLLEEVEKNLDSSLIVSPTDLEEEKKNLEARVEEINRRIELEKMGTPKNEGV
jgi:hypothetical protein